MINIKMDRFVFLFKCQHVLTRSKMPTMAALAAKQQTAILPVYIARLHARTLYKVVQGSSIIKDVQNTKHDVMWIDAQYFDFTFS